IGAAEGNVVGGTEPGQGNLVAFNGGTGILIDRRGSPGENPPPSRKNERNALLSNRVFSNGGLAIDLGGDGVTAHDSGDADAGANKIQNHPVLTSATALGSGSTIVEGTLNSTPNTIFTLQLFLSDTADPSGRGEGQTLLGSTTLTTGGAGDADFRIA